MKVLALDFDGVIFDTVREALVVALRVYLEVYPDSRLRELAARVEALVAAPGGDILEDESARTFLELMPLGNRAEDFGVALRAIDTGAALPDQPAYDRFYATLPAQWLAGFHQRFYEVRTALASSREQAWLGLQPPYPGVGEMLHRRAGDVRLAVATAKDRRSVRLLLSHWGLLDLFPDDLVLDKETGITKTAHLDLIRQRTGVPFPEITFVDDKLNHLDAVASLGVRLVLASWGYNGARERDLARSRGYLVCSLDDFERRLFDRGADTPCCP